MILQTEMGKYGKTGGYAGNISEELRQGMKMAFERKLLIGNPTMTIEQIRAEMDKWRGLPYYTYLIQTEEGGLKFFEETKENKKVSNEKEVSKKTNSQLSLF